MLSGGDEMLQDEVPLRRQALVERAQRTLGTRSFRAPSSRCRSKFMRLRLSGVCGQDFLAAHPPREAVPVSPMKTLHVQ